MQIITYDFFEKDDKYVFKARNLYFLAFKYVFLVFYKTNQMIIYICASEILKTRV